MLQRGQLHWQQRSWRIRQVVIMTSRGIVMPFSFAPSFLLHTPCSPRDCWCAKPCPSLNHQPGAVRSQDITGSTTLGKLWEDSEHGQGMSRTTFATAWCGKLGTKRCRLLRPLQSFLVVHLSIPKWSLSKTFYFGIKIHPSCLDLLELLGLMFCDVLRPGLSVRLLMLSSKSWTFTPPLPRRSARP